MFIQYLYCLFNVYWIFKPCAIFYFGLLSIHVYLNCCSKAPSINGVFFRKEGQSRVRNAKLWRQNFLASNYYLEDISSNSIDNVKRSSFLNTAVQCLFSSVAEIPGLRQHIPWMNTAFFLSRLTFDMGAGHSRGGI